MIDVRDATDADREAIVAVMARAFANATASTWLQPDAAKRKANALVRFGKVFDHTKGGIRLTAANCEAACLWHFSTESERRAHAQTSVSPPDTETAEAKRVRLMMASIEAHAPAGDYWHLQLVGCEPSQQGTGLGAAVLRRGLERVSGHTAYLETTSAKNVGFYRALGFTLMHEWDVPEGGPHFWSMAQKA